MTIPRIDLVRHDRWFGSLSDIVKYDGVWVMENNDIKWLLGRHSTESSYAEDSIKMWKHIIQ